MEWGRVNFDDVDSDRGLIHFVGGTKFVIWYTHKADVELAVRVQINLHLALGTAQHAHFNQQFDLTIINKCRETIVSPTNPIPDITASVLGGEVTVTWDNF